MPFNGLDSPSTTLIGSVGISPDCTDVCVTHDFGDRGHFNAAVRGPGSKGVPKIVKAKVLDTGLRQGRVERRPDISDTAPIFPGTRKQKLAL